MTQHFYQIIFCSERNMRACRREITVTEADAMVTAVEMLPPEYHRPMEMMRDSEEAILSFSTGNLKYWSGFVGCLFCGSQGTFHCDCGYYSCLKSDAKGVHVCPVCKKIGEMVKAEFRHMSDSGFVHNSTTGKVVWQTRREPPAIPGQGGPPAIPGQGRLESRPDLEKFLAEQARKQLEDKRDK